MATNKYIEPKYSIFYKNNDFNMLQAKIDLNEMINIFNDYLFNKYKDSLCLFSF